MSGSSAAGEDIVQHLSSNSNPSSSKLAKLEARMAGKAVSAPSSPPHHPMSAPVISFMDQEELPETSSSDDDNCEEFLIQKNTLKRPRSPDGDNMLALGNFEGSVNEAAKILGVTDTKPSLDNSSRKKQGRGRGRAGTGRGRGSRAADQTRLTSTSSAAVTNGQLDKLTNKEPRSSVQLGHDDRAALQQMKILSDLLIAVSKAERQEARMRIRQESFRLGNVAVMRAGTIISETWEDGQAIKDLNAHLKSLLETKETIERHRKSLKKRQSGDFISEVHFSLYCILLT
ncbi:Tousled-like kinase 1 [Zea mays]|uniref:Tousled-like kinase 1 n=1 Tax=Zea mays TaxID=4577 RepID=A0A1D6L4I3_MAIZE|nr:Tousled-like kinase 1 [Zea mays]